MHANVSLASHERSGLERLCRYILRPPLATGRVERLPDGRVRVGLKRVWSDGTTAMEFSPLELTERLAALVPPFRAHQVVYAGVLAGNASWRGEVIPFVDGVTAAASGAIAGAAFVLGRRAIVDVPTALIAVAALAAMTFLKKAPEPVLIVIAGVVGLFLSPG